MKCEAAPVDAHTLFGIASNTKIAPFESDNTNPAGGVNANAEDMAKWLNVLLATRRRVPRSGPPADRI